MNRREFIKKSLEGIIIGSILLISCCKNPIDSYSNDFYYYYNEKIQLSKKLDQYAVKFHDEIADDRKLEIFSQNNLNLLIDQPISDLYLIKTFTNDIDIKKSIEKIPEVEYVSYCYITADGYEMYLTNSFFATFESGISIEDINSFNKKYNAKIIEKLSSTINWYLLEIPWNSPQNSLEIANIYHESNIVEHASPNYLEKIKQFFYVIFHIMILSL